jgi:ribonuclease HII
LLRSSKLNFERFTISELATFLDQKKEISPEERKVLKKDQRRGVRDLLERFYRKQNSLAQETDRLQKMLREENKLQQQGYHLIAGLDEAGRGPLAGPVLAAAVILRPGMTFQHLNDSKQLTAKRREFLFEQIIVEAKAYGLGSATPEEIDHLNIHEASLLAMERALEKMSQEPDFILVDGFPLRCSPCKQKAIIGGDTLSLSIAAASVLAKVARDEIMQKLHKIYPQYGFNRNKGYGTSEHRQAIANYGLCPEHRKSFRLKDNA